MNLISVKMNIKFTILLGTSIEILNHHNLIIYLILRLEKKIIIWKKYFYLNNNNNMRWNTDIVEHEDYKSRTILDLKLYNKQKKKMWFYRFVQKYGNKMHKVKPYKYS